MSTQTILWTALPNGFAAKGHAVRLSVHVSPRLVSDTGTIADFPDFLDWPAIVSSLRLAFEFNGGPTIAATPITEPGFPALDSEVWTALFPSTTPVTSHVFQDLSDLPVRSFPTRKIFSFLTQTYQTIAIKTPDKKPTLTQLGFGDGESLVSLNQIAILSDQQAGLEQRLNEVLNSRDRTGRPRNAIPSNFGGPQTDFLQLRLMHQFLSAYKPFPPGDQRGGNAIPQPAQTLPDIDFHKAVASTGQYPKLMRALGLVIDVELPIEGLPATSQVRVVVDIPGSQPMTPWTAYRLDQVNRRFVAASAPGSDVTDGMLQLAGPADYDVVEMDVDGAGQKSLDFSYNLARLGFGDAPTSIDTPDQYGLPSLRSAGFSAARVDRATRLVNTFRAAQSMNAQITADPRNSKFFLHAEDVTRGYRIDVWTSLSGKWHSLCQREGSYKLLDGALLRHFADEGFVTVATTQSSDGTTTDLRLPESLFRWAGWSLCAPRPGKTIGGEPDGFGPVEPANPATTSIKMETSFLARKGSLPRLRFGAQYQFRARAVDLAGNSLPPDAVLSNIYSLPPQPIPYLRYEPVAAPAVVLRHPLGPITTPGESGNRIVIRSNYNTHISAVSERHIAPPKTTQTMAETHGMLDTPAGPPDKALYATLVAKDGDFGTDPAVPHPPLPHPEAQLMLPYLPDPFAPGAAFAGLPGATPSTITQVPFTLTPHSGLWPDTTPFRLVLDEGSGPPVFTEDTTERVLRVQLPKADVVTVAMSCFLTDDPTSNPPNMLSTMKIWALIEAAAPPDLDHLRQLALEGQHWMLTPPRILTLVHAVQQPLIDPEFQHLQANRSLGQTSATLTDEFPISGKSTIKVDIQATWTEPVDDGTSAAQPVILNGAMRAFEVPVEANETVIPIDDLQGDTKHFSSKHEFHDTKHRNVTYTAVATTRFMEYFPDSLRSDPANFTRTSQPLTISVPSSARPAAPRPLYALPTFGWDASTEGAWTVSKRSGGGLRIYLDRPWFSSGEGELLAAVLLGCAPPEAGIPGYQLPDAFKGFVTQWGKDPIWSGSALPTQAVPLPAHFLNAVKIGTELSLDEFANNPFVTFTAAGHTVSYDNTHGRELWYSDILMDMGAAYCPFVRLALARYQPESIPGAHLSRVVLLDFAQLLPDRSASITFDPIDTTSVQLAISGLTYTGPNAASVTVTLQTQPLGGGELAWLPLSVIEMQPNTFAGPNTLWTAQITLPSPRGSRPFRLVVEEFEIYTRDLPGSQQRRRIYADILNV